jgi:LemA protein
VAAWVFIGLPVLIAVTAVGGCARLGALRGRVQDTGAQLKGHLQRRRDLVGSLIESFPDPDRARAELLKCVAQAREQATRALGIPARAEAENELTRSLHTLLAVAEAEPGFWASPTRRKLQEELLNNENEILTAGRCYNQQVMALNVTISRVLWRLVARPAGFRPVEYFVLDEPPRPGAPHDV